MVKLKTFNSSKGYGNFYVDTPSGSINVTIVSDSGDFCTVGIVLDSPTFGKKTHTLDVYPSPFVGIGKHGEVINDVLADFDMMHKRTILRDRQRYPMWLDAWVMMHWNTNYRDIFLKESEDLVKRSTNTNPAKTN